jgi:hypothetical protein
MAPRAGMPQVLLNQSCQTEALIEVANEPQTRLGGHPRPLNLHTQALMAQALARLMACLPQGVVLWEVVVTLDPARRPASKANIL